VRKSPSEPALLPPYLEFDVSPETDRAELEEQLKGPTTIEVGLADGRSAWLINATGRILEPPPPLIINGRELERPPAPLRVRWEGEWVDP
jgi:hypothetical protein